MYSEDKLLKILEVLGTKDIDSYIQVDVQLPPCEKHPEKCLKIYVSAISVALLNVIEDAVILASQNYAPQSLIEIVCGHSQHIINEFYETLNELYNDISKKLDEVKTEIRIADSQKENIRTLDLINYGFKLEKRLDLIRGQMKKLMDVTKQMKKYCKNI